MTPRPRVVDTDEATLVAGLRLGDHAAGAHTTLPSTHEGRRDRRDRTGLERRRDDRVFVAVAILLDLDLVHHLGHVELVGAHVSDDRTQRVGEQVVGLLLSQVCHGRPQSRSMI